MLNIDINFKRITAEDRLKQFNLGRLLGKGANAMVFSIKDQQNQTWALKSLIDFNFEYISSLFKECSFNLLFDNNNNCPLISLQEMFLSHEILNKQDKYILHILMEEGKIIYKR